MVDVDPFCDFFTSVLIICIGMVFSMLNSIHADIKLEVGFANAKWLELTLGPFLGCLAACVYPCTEKSLS
jgi:hypothetical protein